jgi:hypothetical protein
VAGVFERRSFAFDMAERLRRKCCSAASLIPVAAATGAELSLTDPIHATMISGIGG